jgi:TolB-like protein
MTGSPPEPDTESLRPVLLIVGVIVVGALIIGSAMLSGRRLSRVTAAAERLAVVPFTAERGDTTLVREGEDLAVTVALTVGAAPNVRVVDPPSVLARVSGRLARDDARSIARALGARYFVSGQIQREHGTLRFEGGLFPADSGYQSRVFASGPEGDLVATTDAIAQAVLFKIWAGHHMPVVSLAAATTGSRAALAAFVDGERELGAGRTNEAAVAYAQAIRGDSTFALAWERLARVAAQRGDTAMVRRARLARRSLPIRTP